MDKGNIKILFIGLLFLISLSVIVFSDTTLNTYIPGTSWNQNVTGQWLNRTGILGNIMGSNILANVTKGGVCGNYTFFINVSQGSATTHINLSSINISLPTGWTYNGNNYTVNYTQSPSALTTVTIDLSNSTTWGNQSFASVNTTNKSRFYGMGKHVSINWTQQIVNFVSNTTYYMNLSLTDSVNNTNSSIMYVFFVGNITIRNGTTDSYKNASIIRGDDDGLLFNATPYTNRWNNCSLYADFNGNYVVNQTITPGYLDERVNPMLTFNKINVSDNSTGYKYEINCTDVIGGQAIMLDTRELGISTHQIGRAH